jgi:hypothetical protein
MVDPVIEGLKERLAEKKKTYREHLILTGICTAATIGFSFAWHLFSIVVCTLAPISILLIGFSIIDYKSMSRTRADLEERCKTYTDDFLNNTWRDLYGRYKYGQGWYDEQMKKKRAERERQEEEERRRNNYYQYQYQSYSSNQRYQESDVQLAYKFLEIAYGSGIDAVNKAYRKLALKYHPDHGGNVEKFKLLVHHKEVLYRYLGAK